MAGSDGSDEPRFDPQSPKPEWMKDLDQDGLRRLHERESRKTRALSDNYVNARTRERLKRGLPRGFATLWKHLGTLLGFAELARQSEEADGGDDDQFRRMRIWRWHRRFIPLIALILVIIVTASIYAAVRGGAKPTTSSQAVSSAVTTAGTGTVESASTTSSTADSHTSATQATQAVGSGSSPASSRTAASTASLSTTWLIWDWSAPNGQPPYSWHPSWHVVFHGTQESGTITVPEEETATGKYKATGGSVTFDITRLVSGAPQIFHYEFTGYPGDEWKGTVEVGPIGSQDSNPPWVTGGAATRSESIQPSAPPPAAYAEPHYLAPEASHTLPSSAVTSDGGT